LFGLPRSKSLTELGIEFVGAMIVGIDEQLAIFHCRLPTGMALKHVQKIQTEVTM
jgi:hypothetical protein